MNNFRDECAYCGHDRICHIQYSNKVRCEPSIHIGPLKLNTKWLPKNWCGCQKFQEPHSKPENDWDRHLPPDDM